LAAAKRILAIDAGNTRIKWGVSDGSKWDPGGATPTREAEGLAHLWARVGKVAAAIASNVAGPGIRREIERACTTWDWPLTVIEPQPQQLGVTNGYRDHRQLGPDRWAALIASHHGYPGHKLVVNAGTALTVDALLADGQFLGGLIVPGPALMRRALDNATAGLRPARASTEGRFDAFPVRTPDAIFSGAIQACVGAVERMRASMAAGGCPPERVILSGGAAGEIAPHLPLEHALNENLVLDGLALIARDA
jgi:type III pantothenate kinase